MGSLPALAESPRFAPKQGRPSGHGTRAKFPASTIVVYCEANEALSRSPFSHVDEDSFIMKTATHYLMLTVLVVTAVLVSSCDRAAVDNDKLVAAEVERVAAASKVKRVVVAANEMFVYVEYELTKHDDSTLAWGWEGDVWGAGTTEMSLKAGKFQIRVMRALDDQRWSAMDLVTWNNAGSKGHAGAEVRTGDLKKKMRGEKKGIKLECHVVDKEQLVEQKRVPLFTIALPDGSKGVFWVRLIKE
ncbi:MAG: hypothetical protein IID44_28840 [Planctomycetes bacterium]|nr:hypothetical protein [Planctomycetota bacterium]